MTFLNRGDALGMHLSKFVKNGTLKSPRSNPVRCRRASSATGAQGCRRRQGSRRADRQPHRLSHGDPRIRRRRRAAARAHLISGELRCRHISHRGAAGHARSEHGLADRRQLYRRHDVHDALLRGPRRVRKALSVIKKRTGMHETTIREIGVRRGALSVGEPLVDFRGVLTGVPEYRGASLKVNCAWAKRHDATRRRMPGSTSGSSSLPRSARMRR